LKDLFAFLKKVYFFQDLPDGQIKKIQQVCHQIEYQPGQIIFEEGSQADRFYIVAEGAVEVWKDYRLPDKDLLAVHERGHLFGEMALIDELPRSATVLAKEPTRLFYIDRDDFHRIIQNNSEIAISILKSVSDMVRSSNEYFVENLRERARELEKTNQALQEAQEELLRKDRLSTLGKFSSLILHDIRNPLSILRSMAEMIILNSNESAKVERNAKRIITEADRLNQIASELLDYSRGEIRLNMTIVNLESFFNRILDAVEEKLQARDIKVITEIKVSQPVIMDEQRMFRVFYNLADNARKAMPQGGIFTIRAFKADQTLKVEVSDTGVGMDPSIQRKIFDPFFSYSDEGGTGLGMSIVKSVIEAHNGTLFVTSKPKGGTTFRVTLPLID
jgi:signal transduction histidine kinase